MCIDKLYDKIIRNSKEAERQYLSMATKPIVSKAKKLKESPLTDEAFKEQLERVLRNNVLDTDIRITGDTVIGAKINPEDKGLFLRSLPDEAILKECKERGLDVKYSEEENLAYRLNWVMQDYYKAGKDEEEREHRLKCYKLFWDALEDETFFEHKEQKSVEYLDKDKVYVIMTKLTNLSYSQLIPINSDEYKQIYEITHDVRSLLDYPIKQKPVDDKAFEEWIDDWWKHNKVNNPNSYDKREQIKFDERGFKNFCRGIRNMYAEQKPANKEEYVKRFKALCDAYEIKLPNREYDIYHLCDDLSKLSIDSGKQKSAEIDFEDWDTLGYIRDIVREHVRKDEDFNILDKWLIEHYVIHEPAEWSEEDENMIRFYEMDYNNQIGNWSAKKVVEMRLAFKDWLCIRLKSIRPSWKPSEEELVALKHVGSILRNYGHGELAKTVFMIEGKLANLSVINKSIWKPSEEQMKHLERCFSHGHTVGLPNQHVLESLYNDLKKLM